MVTATRSAPAENPVDPVMARLQSQIEWYDLRSQQNQRAYKRLKLLTIIFSAMIPLAPIAAPPLTVSVLGVCLIVFEGLQQLNQYHSLWLSYRATCESLRHEKYLFLARAAYYATAKSPRALLAERMESLISQEHAKWVTTNQTAVSENGKGRDATPAPAEVTD
jgi:hypothetical protein